MIFLRSLKLDPGRQTNFDKVCLDALHESFPDDYKDAVEFAEQQRGWIPDEALQEFLKRLGTDYTALEE